MGSRPSLPVEYSGATTLSDIPTGRSEDIGSRSYSASFQSLATYSQTAWLLNRAFIAIESVTGLKTAEASTENEANIRVGGLSYEARSYATAGDRDLDVSSRFAARAGDIWLTVAGRPEDGRGEYGTFTPI